MCVSGIEQKCFQTAYKIEDLNNFTRCFRSSKKQQQQTNKTNSNNTSSTKATK